MAKLTEKPSEERSVAVLLHMLRNRNRKFTVAEIERWLNQDEAVTKRSVQRSMQKLVQMRGAVVIEEVHGREKRYCIEPDFRADIEVPIQKNSLLALFLLKRLQPFFARDKRLYDDLGDMLREMGGNVDDEIFDELDSHLEEYIELMGSRVVTPLQGETLNGLLTAAVSKHRCVIQYQNAKTGAITLHDICPVRFFMVDNELFLAAVYRETDARAYYFKLCRISGVELLESVFSIPAEQLLQIKTRLR